MFNSDMFDLDSIIDDLIDMTDGDVDKMDKIIKGEPIDDDDDDEEDEENEIPLF